MSCILRLDLFLLSNRNAGILYIQFRKDSVKKRSQKNKNIT